MRSFLASVVVVAFAACGGQAVGVGPSADAGSDAQPRLDAGPTDAGPPDDASPADGAVVTDGRPPADAGNVELDACVPPQPASPTFDPPPGNYGCPVSVKLAIATPNATIYYTIDTTNPTTTSQVYTAPITINPGHNDIRAVAVSAGPCSGTSSVVDGVYTFFTYPPPSAPTVAPAGGTFHKAFTATLTSALGTPAEVYCYTLDGTPATCSATCSMEVSAACTGTSKTYDGAKLIAIDGTVTDPKTGRVTLDPLGCQKGGGTVPGTAVTYTLQVDPVAIAPGAATAIDGSGTLGGLQITENGPATDEPYASICWSTDGTSVPDCACKGATAADAAATVGPGLYVSKGSATPVMSVTKAPGAAGITVRAVGCAAGYAPSDAPYASATWH